MSEKKVIVEYAEKWTSGGIESYILNLVKHLNRDKYVVRIVVAQKETEIYDKELEKYDTSVECILQEVYENPIVRMIENRKLFMKYFSEHPCDVLHLHICQGVALGYAKMAKKIAIPKVVSHCHNTEFGDGAKIMKFIGHYYGKYAYEKYLDVLVACSDLAAEWLYTKSTVNKGKVIIAKYIVEVDDFLFSEEKRNEFREKYNIALSTRVYLNIGRLHYQKNQLFLIDIFREMVKIDGDCKLILIGTGELKDKIYDYVKQLNLLQHIIFIDKTREIASYMSMSDIFVLPSLYEGNPIVGTEAQANGLPCFFSDRITKQAKVLPTTHYIEISKKAGKLAAEIIGYAKETDKDYRKSAVNIMKENGYDVIKQINMIETIYDKARNYD